MCAFISSALVFTLSFMEHSFQYVHYVCAMRVHLCACVRERRSAASFGLKPTQFFVLSSCHHGFAMERVIPACPTGSPDGLRITDVAVVGVTSAWNRSPRCKLPQGLRLHLSWADGATEELAFVYNKSGMERDTHQALSLIHI